MLTNVSDETILRNNGEQLKKARLLRSMSREFLAHKAGVHPNTIAVIERGERDLNGLTQTRIFAALGCIGINVYEDRDVILLMDEAKIFSRKDIMAIPDANKISLMGDGVRQRRLSMNMSLEELAALTDRHRNTIWNYERGFVSPSGLTIHRIYCALGVSKVFASEEGMILS